MIFISKSESETAKLAFDFAGTLRGGEIITLKGELGAGKTVFTKGLAKGLKIEDDVLSPTFTIMNEYSGRLNLYHFDAYRLSGYDEAYEAGLIEYFALDGGVCVVEWAENIADVLKDFQLIKIEINYLGEDIREIKIYDK